MILFAIIEAALAAYGLGTLVLKVWRRIAQKIDIVWGEP